MHLEPIEPRLLLAGQVNAVIDGDKLIVRGDAAANVVSLSTFNKDGSRPYLYADGLFVDGKPATERLYFGAVKRIDIHLGGGDDLLSLARGNFNRLRVTLGDGDDRVEWLDTSFVDPSIEFGAGDDRFTMIGKYALGSFTLLGGAGRDRFTFGEGVDAGSLTLVDRTGPTRFNSTGANFNDLTISTGNSADVITLTGGNVNGDLAIAARAGDDAVRLADYLQPSSKKHAVNAGTGANVVADNPTLRPPPKGRLDVTLRGSTLDINGTGPLTLNMGVRYGSFEETLGTVLQTDAALYVNGIRKPTRTALFGLRSSFSSIRVALDDAPQAFTYDYDDIGGASAIDVSTGGGADTIHIGRGLLVIGINSGGGDDRVRVSAPGAVTSVRLGGGRDRFHLSQTHQRAVSVTDAGGPANVTLEDVTVFGELAIRTSDAIDHITLTDVNAKTLWIAARGGTDVIRELNVRTDRRDVDPGAQ
ncbi:MAG TPA: hypothetical protein VF624_01040 [Tepidisphaeraceae bacterium]|jgi:hypothetical protein